MAKYVKYPRTLNAPFSLSNSSDDVWLKDCSHLEGKEVIATIKMDGECTSMYSDHCHARSLDSGHHLSRAWVKNLHGQIQHLISPGMRVCGENLYAYHSIFYTDLPTYFLVFGIYDQDNFCLSWDEVEEYCELMGLKTVPVFYRGIWDEELIRKQFVETKPYPTFAASKDHPKWPDDFQPTNQEGFVVRLADKFHYNDFGKSVLKYVDARFKQSMRQVHWATAEIIPNKLLS